MRVLFSLLALLALEGCSEARAACACGPHVVVAMLGDSNTRGSQVSITITPTNRMITALVDSGSALNYGIDGDTAFNMNASGTRLTAILALSSVTHVWIAGGMNDIILSDTTPTAATVYSYVESLWTRTIAAGKIPVAFTVTQVKSSSFNTAERVARVNALNALIRSGAASYKIPLVDAWDLLKDNVDSDKLETSPAYDCGDGLHWSDTAGQLLVDTFKTKVFGG